VLAEGPAAVGNHTIILKLYSVLKKNYLRQLMMMMMMMMSYLLSQRPF
jgi:hypothetical protein